MYMNNFHKTYDLLRPTTITHNRSRKIIANKKNLIKIFKLKPYEQSVHAGCKTTNENNKNNKKKYY